MIRAILAFALAALWALGAAAQDYRLQPGDTIEVSVLEDPGLNRQVLIRPDGKVSLPLAGTVQAAGLTPEAVQRAVRGRLAGDFVEPPTVTVSLLGLGAEDLEEEAPEGLASVYVLGQVGAPGRYDVLRPVDILQALALAGGPGVFAARERIQVRRRESGGDVLMLFNYDDVEEGRVPLAPIDLRDGDVIVVPERGLFE
jgi:polysaccharide export outer membrane protein